MSKRKIFVKVDVSGICRTDIMALLEAVFGEDEEELDNLICDSDNEFEYVDEAVRNTIENESLKKTIENKDEYSLDAVVKRQRKEPEDSSSDPSTGEEKQSHLKNPGIPVVPSLKKKNTIDAHDIKLPKININTAKLNLTLTIVTCRSKFNLTLIMKSVSEFVIWFLDLDELFRLIVKESMSYAQLKGVAFVVTTEEVKGKAGGPSSKFGLGGDVLLSLTSSLKFTYARVFADNYFSSKKRKGLPECIPDKELRKTTGSMDAYVNVNAGVGSLNGSTPGQYISFFSMNACHDTVMVNCRKKGNSQELQIPCPTVVKLYNTHMGGVDKADQLVSLESGAENLPLNSTCAYTLIISNRQFGIRNKSHIQDIMSMTPMSSLRQFRFQKHSEDSIRDSPSPEPKKRHYSGDEDIHITTKKKRARVLSSDSDSSPVKCSPDDSPPLIPTPR
ncbi:unnamed protein product [Lepeophtheirus salmonis]|uniref:(salmon louse) hypothetical protein n=1 Tax=Lepeophtheirus salmonis TaxID=72036 RepID=A0A7R8HDZ8_LEPSM|nr:unnamed protein product [Lepeophtheirus salmonis]CAF3020693.1 unnamed protein product [Lepeophtheirus salmonis]